MGEKLAIMLDSGYFVFYLKNPSMVKDRSEHSVQTQIRLPLKEQADQVLTLLVISSTFLNAIGVGRGPSPII